MDEAEKYYAPHEEGVFDLNYILGSKEHRYVLLGARKALERVREWAKSRKGDGWWTDSDVVQIYEALTEIEKELTDPQEEK